MTQLELWIALSEILGARSPLFLPLLEQFKTPEGIFCADREALASAAEGIGKGTLSRILKGPAATDARRILSWCRKNGVKVLAFGEEGYPAACVGLPEPPIVLYCRGTLPDEIGRFSIGIVGKRETDEYGARVTYKLSFELASAGAVIVSGMADGIDGIASAGALDAGGKTVAVLGCGVDIAYPRHHAKLMREIVERGAVLSEYAPGTRPNGWNFPIRNRLISALSGALLVTEADGHSGALITAKYAMMQGKALFAVPGDITNIRSEGTNRLLEDGAGIAISSESVLSHFRFLYRASVRDEQLARARAHSEYSAEKLRAHGLKTYESGGEKPAARLEKPLPFDRAPVDGLHTKKTEASAELDGSMLTERQREILSMLPAVGMFPLDVLTEKGISAGEAASTMTIFELYGFVAARPGGLYEKMM